MLLDLIEQWEQILENVDKQKIPIEFIKKVVFKLEGKRQQTINIEKLLEQNLDIVQIEDVLNTKLDELDTIIVTIEFILNIERIAEIVQPETDRLLSNLS
jgi:hypothetical protein